MEHHHQRVDVDVLWGEGGLEPELGTGSGFCNGTGKKTTTIGSRRSSNLSVVWNASKFYSGRCRYFIKLLMRYLPPRIIMSHHHHHQFHFHLHIGLCLAPHLPLLSCLRKALEDLLIWNQFLLGVGISLLVGLFSTYFVSIFRTFCPLSGPSVLFQGLLSFFRAFYY